MRLNQQCFPSITFLLLTVLITVTYAAAQSHAPKEKVLFSFPASGDLGNSPNGVLISDAAGNFYGVNTHGGLGSGTVYEISPAAEGGWTAKSIYVFPKSSAGPGGLVMDSSGNLYGVLSFGGTEVCTDTYNDYLCGAVYQLSPNGSGGWSEKIIWNASQTEGWAPWTLALDAAGNLYGTTFWAGTGNAGTVYELQRTGESWTHTVLHVGGPPQGPLVFDKAGNLYGTTYGGGTAGIGTVFELKKTTTGWQEITLFDFSGGASGSGPVAVIFDSAGNLYGTTYYGGVDRGDGYGVAYELTPTPSGAWQETVLHTFLNGGQAEYRLGFLVFDSKGNLYGTRDFGGSEGYGTVFQLKRSSSGAWSELVLHNFQSGSTDGQHPNGGLLVDSKGNLYGTTSGGGSAGFGTVFEIKP